MQELLPAAWYQGVVTWMVHKFCTLTIPQVRHSISVDVGEMGACQRSHVVQSHMQMVLKLIYITHREAFYEQICWGVYLQGYAYVCILAAMSYSL